MLNATILSAIMTGSLPFKMTMLSGLLVRRFLEPIDPRVEVVVQPRPRPDQLQGRIEILIKKTVGVSQPL
jgi:hypothetical protein